MELQKFWFTCEECGRPFYIEGTHLTPGLVGTIVDTDGELFIFVDPTIEPKLCLKCKIMGDQT